MASMIGLGAAAAATSLSALYLNAKYGVSQDMTRIGAQNKALKEATEADKQGKLSLFYVLERNAQSAPDAASLFYAPTGSTETWSSTYTTVLRFATYLTMKGVGAGHVVAVDFTNKLTLLHLWLALAALGAFPAFINYNLTGAPLLHCVKVCKTKLLLVDDEVRTSVSPFEKEIAALGVEVDYLDDDAIENISRNMSAERPSDEVRRTAPLDTGSIFYTSGTTGFPKPAIFTVVRWWGAGYIIPGILGMKRPFTTELQAHASLCASFSRAVIAWVTNFPFPNSGPRSDLPTQHLFVMWERLVGTYSMPQADFINISQGAPPSPEDQNHSVHTAFGNGLRPDVWEAFRTRFGLRNICEFYGASEAVATLLNYNSGPYGVGSVGKSGALLRFLDRNALVAVGIDQDTQEPIRKSDGTCIPVCKDEPGELLEVIPERAAFVGYYRDDAASEKKIIRDVLKKGDIYFRTGDLLRENEDGMWYFVDRIGDTFRWKSENVSTMEVAESLSTLPGIAEISVYGVQLPHHDGRAGCAVILMDPPDRKPDFVALARLAKQSLPKYAIPLFIRWTTKIRRTENNKSLKGDLKKDGVDLPKIEDGGSGDKLFWLKGGLLSGKEVGGYVEFRGEDWKALENGSIRL